jgi:hypothetical protein
MIIHSHSKNRVNISNQSEIKWWQLNIWPNFKVQGLAVLHFIVTVGSSIMSITHTLKWEIKIEKFTGPNKVFLILGRRTSAHHEDCKSAISLIKFVSSVKLNSRSFSFTSIFLIASCLLSVKHSLHSLLLFTKELNVSYKLLKRSNQPFKV